MRGSILQGCKHRIVQDKSMCVKMETYWVKTEKDRKKERNKVTSIRASVEQGLEAFDNQIKQKKV